MFFHIHLTISLAKYLQFSSQFVNPSDSETWKFWEKLSTPWLLMTWWCKEPSHLQTWYRLCRNNSMYSHVLSPFSTSSTHVPRDISPQLCVVMKAHLSNPSTELSLTRRCNNVDVVPCGDVSLIRTYIHEWNTQLGNTAVSHYCRILHRAQHSPTLLLTHCGLMTPYGNRDLGQHWLR